MRKLLLLIALFGFKAQAQQRLNIQPLTLVATEVSIHPILVEDSLVTLHYSFSDSTGIELKRGRVVLSVADFNTLISAKTKESINAIITPLLGITVKRRTKQ